MEAHARSAAGLGDLDDIADQPLDRVVGQVVRIGSRAGRIAALIGCDRVEAGVSERGELIGPGVTRLREAVEEKDERPVGRAGDPGVKGEARGSSVW